VRPLRPGTFLALVPGGVLVAAFASDLGIPEGWAFGTWACVLAVAYLAALRGRAS
jgi:hypothetical protein